MEEKRAAVRVSKNFRIVGRYTIVDLQGREEKTRLSKLGRYLPLYTFTASTPKSPKTDKNSRI